MLTAEWQKRDDQRQHFEDAFQPITEGVLASRRDTYIARALAQLQGAERSHRAEDEPTEYGAFDMDAILGDLDDEIDEWLDGLGPDWLDSWEAGATSAMDGVEDGFLVDPVEPLPTSLDRLRETSEFMADYSQERVRFVVDDGVDQGLPPIDIAENLRKDQGFSRVRSQRIARTESARSQISGSNARFDQAERQGIELERLWLTARDTHVRRSHRALEGKVADGKLWTFPDGVTTEGPALSGEPKHDINCRCSSKARRKKPPT